MLKNIGNKIYFFVICILVISIVYQTGYLIMNSRGLSSPTINHLSTDEDRAQVSEKSVDSNDDLQESGSTQEEVKAASTEEVDEISAHETETKEEDIFLNIFKMGMPYNQQKTSIITNINAIVKYLTSIDIYDPRTLLSSQMPILGYEEQDVEISPEEQQEIYNITTSKPLNDDEISENTQVGDEPLVLIYHTHTTESYTSTDKYHITYTNGDNYRSKESEHNMIAVGNEITKVIEEKYGVKVIHDTTTHDIPYDQSYKRSKETIEKDLKKYPSIKYVFDVHRDGLTVTDGNKKKYKVSINNTPCAKIMMVVGLNHDNSAKNSKFSDEVYKKMKEMYPGLPLSTVKRETATYNQFVRDNAVLFEVGSNLSTLEEAKASGTLLGDVIGKIITEKELK